MLKQNRNLQLEQPDTPSIDELAQLDKILASPYFARSERLRRFLQFTVSVTVRGESAILKESVLAIEVFDRDSTYDPRVDSVVRVQASRLRLKLQEYYRNEGACDPVETNYPRGSYVPEFTPRPVPEEVAPLPQPSTSTPAPFRSLFSNFTAAWRVSLLLTQILVLWTLLTLWRHG